jgi:hypothetical protein
LREGTEQATFLWQFQEGAVMFRKFVVAFNAAMLIYFAAVLADASPSLSKMSLEDVLFTVFIFGVPLANLRFIYTAPTQNKSEAEASTFELARQVVRAKLRKATKDAMRPD